MKSNTKILVTGLGSISALGYGAAAAWRKMVAGEDGITIKADWEHAGIHPQFFGETPAVEFDSEVKWDDRFPPQQYSKLGMLACKKAIDDAGIMLEASDNEIGLVIETSLGATASVEDYLYDLYRHGLQKISPVKFTKTVANTVLGDISRIFKLNGPSSLIYNSNSITYGFDLIRKGVAEIVICGGVDHYTEYRILSEQESNRLVRVACHSNARSAAAGETDRRRNILGDGAAFIVLESEASAVRRGARKYAELVEYHSCFDYRNIEDTTQRSADVVEGAIDALRPILQPKEKVAYLSAYTTAGQMESNERHVLNRLSRSNETYSLQHKAYTGDMKSASSIMGASIASQILYNNQFPVQEAFGNNPSDFGYALVNTAHEGGGSSHLLLRKTL
ncbi:MAG TPA: beta-ketoacyl synthase N-terminal-like domain-containing protein [Chitinophaga sp.]|uniref:beta-ketoacyl synthase N-terminal-like domain-containing protein n=1 Tax=Chitinophaga sp. TaxID=1869181 RepID=UPI002DBE65FD|nr:beta-ketoacyl synthase N-terminal-like domain-containing protein [Chitinophaga sp.]HEU4552192.1 beta-ketoacyl synthase N-terminal-like domain-containing protein [Chitinophaga sp.]